MSVGGSLIVPQEIDIDFLRRLRQFIESETDRRFVIIAGGGRTARRYQEAARSIADLNSDDLDWLGIHATRVNGHLLRTIFKNIAHPIVYHKLDEGIKDIDSRLIIAAGAKPGFSSDYVATFYASKLGAKRLVNLSNIDHVYTADPKIDPGAKPIEKISWGEFRKLIPSEWDPGLSSPFDPVAAREAETHNIEVACINGGKLEELKKYLEGQPFIGTLIKN